MHNAASVQINKRIQGLNNKLYFRLVKKDFQYFIIHKPYKVLSQYTDEGANPGLSSVFDLPKGVYPVGRLDLDSEGLLILTNDKSLTEKLLNPKYAHKREYCIARVFFPSLVLRH